MLLATALLTTAVSVGASAIPLTVDIVADQPGASIWVNETSLDLLGTMGGDPTSLKVVNTGLAVINQTYVVDDGSSEQLAAGLTIDGISWNSYSKVLASNESDVQELSVDGESGQTALEGSVTIWARAASANELEGPADWASFQGSSHYLGITPNAGPVNGFDEAMSWTANLDPSGFERGVDAGLIAADGKIFAVNHCGEVYAVDADTGDIVWAATSIASHSDYDFELSTPAYHDGVLYVALNKNVSDDGFSVHALNSTTGEVLWSDRDFGTGIDQPNTPIVYDDGRIYLGTWDSLGGVGTYYCLDASDGSLIWSKDSVANTGYYWTGAAVIGSYLVFGDYGGNVTSVNKLTGTTVQEISLADVFGTEVQPIRSSTAYSADTGRIYLTDKGGYCYALGYDGTTGHFDTADKWATHIGLSTCTPAVYDGKVYVGTGEILASDMGTGLYCLNESNGEVLWNYVDTVARDPTSFGIIQSSVVISTYYDNGDGEVYIYFTTNVLYGSVYCLNGDGDLMWLFTPSDEQCQYVLHGAVVYDGRVYYANDRGILFALGGD